MSGHPTLTTAVYILIVVAFCSAIAYMIFYNRRVKASKTDYINKGQMASGTRTPSDPNVGSGRPGTKP